MRSTLLAMLAVLAAATPATADQVPVPQSMTATQMGLPRHLIIVRVDKQTATVYVYSANRGRYVTRARYDIATGRSGFSTPRGIFFTVNEVRDPSWTAPDEPWVPPSWKGTTFGPGTPENPLTGTWLGLGGLPPGRSGIGFHGTKEDSSIGARASHGCLRMHTDDSDALARIVEIGTAVIIR
jgi:lipoprotein-anchoring transpeptidase ErfK/SrfK